MFDAAFRRKECGPRDERLLCVAPVHHVCLPAKGIQEGRWWMLVAFQDMVTMELHKQH